MGLKLEWEEADAEALPFPDSDFDVVMSCIGAMFAPHHQVVADELVRVCRPKGTIGLELDPGGHDRWSVQDHGSVRGSATTRGTAATALGI